MDIDSHDTSLVSYPSTDKGVSGWHIWAAWSEVEFFKCFTQARCPIPFVPFHVCVIYQDYHEHKTLHGNDG